MWPYHIRIAAKGDLITTILAIFGYLHVCDAAKVEPSAGSLITAHNLYAGGYEYGIKSKFGTIEDINFGCDKLLSWCDIDWWTVDSVCGMKDNNRILYLITIEYFILFYIILHNRSVYCSYLQTAEI